MKENKNISYLKQKHPHKYKTECVLNESYSTDLVSPLYKT